MSSGVLLLNGEDVGDLLSLESLVASQRDAFVALAQGTARLGERIVVDGPDESATFSYVARISDDSPPITKFGSVVPTNRGRDLPTVSASILALDPVTGRLAALIDADVLTNLRTVAASVMAIRALHPEPRAIAVIGSGEQGRLHARTCSALLAPESVVMTSVSLDPNNGHLADLSRVMLAESGVRLATTADAEQAVRGADLIICATTSMRPVLLAEWLCPGATVVSIGSFAADRCEVGRDVVVGADVVVDHLPTALVHAGPVVDGVREGLLAIDDIGEIGQVLLGVRALDRDPERVTYYNSVGVGVQDAAAVKLLLEAAARSGRGKRVDW